MDQLDLIRKARELFGKYKYVILIVAVGIFLMVLPTGQTKTEEQPEQSAGITEETDTAKELESILSQIQGVGKVRVMLSEAAAAETVYQTDVDEDRSEESTSSRTKTVVVSDGSSDKGLIRIPEELLGDLDRGLITGRAFYSFRCAVSSDFFFEFSRHGTCSP